MQKKTLILISIILLVVLIFLVGYYFLPKTTRTDTGSSPSFKNFFPFGGNDQTPATSTNKIDEPKQPEQPEAAADFTKKLRKITSEQVSGAGTLDVKAGSVVRYIEKATGHIYETELFSPRTARISNTTIPMVYDSLWGNGGVSLMARYLKDDNQTVDTYSLSLNNLSSSTENTVKGSLFPKETYEISVFENNVFYMTKNKKGSLGFVSAFDGTKTKTVWSSAVTEVSSQFINKNTVTLTTKPHPNIPGFMYSIDTNTGKVTKILGNIPGLSTNSNSDLSKVLYAGQGESLRMFMYDQKTKTASPFAPSTFPEKCVWSKKKSYMLYCAAPKSDLSGTSMINWYLGSTSYNDYIWELNTASSTAYVLSDLSEESGEEIDVIKPILTENEHYIIFINKKDNSLWSLDLTR